VSLFLTGTDTGVGKTFVAVELLRLLREAGIRAVGMKPICCGNRDDVRRLLAAGAEDATIEELNPVWLQSPVAPSVAARIERIEIDIEKIHHRFTILSQRFEIVLVEGVGGWLVPIAPNFFVSDLAKRLNLPVVIVTENRLGCLNHVLLTCQSIRNCGFSCAGIILNRADAAGDLAQTTNEGELRRLLPDTILLPVAETGVQTPAKWAQLFAQNTRNDDVFRKLTQL
jgi:dethiobiotin synthetase